MGRILLVDDRPENLRALEAVLEPLGHSLATASSGEEALSCLLREKVDLILLDVMMPGLDGFETAELIKRRERVSDVPIIFLTAMNQAVEHHLRGYETGAVDYITKPFDAHILRSKVSLFLDLHDKREQLRAQAKELSARLEERDRAERALARRTADLARSNMQLDQFVQIASHELREPMDTMAGLLELIEDRCILSSDEELRLFAGRALAQVDRMRQAVSSLLQSGGRGPNPTDVVELDKALDQALSNLEGAIRAAGAQVVRGDLPTVCGDLWQLTEVFEHLIDNAIKFRGSDPPLIQVDASDGPGEQVISVKDNGQGIDHAEHARIFTVFGRFADDGSMRESGIGLPLCRRIVEGLGGRIWVESAPGAGSTISFTLPRPAG
jgi:two-component system sensor histidine kinase/response regulator